MKKYITILIILLGIVGCENEIRYKGKDVEPTLVMNALINTDSITNLIYLNYTGKSATSDVDAATVEIYINDEFQETVTEVPTTDEFKQKRYIPRCRFKPGDKVRIEAKTGDGKHHIWAEETVPYPTNIIQVDTTDIPLTINDMNNYYKKLLIKVKFRDRPGEKNFYRIALDQYMDVKGITNDGGKDTIVSVLTKKFWSWNDMVLTEGRPASTEELENDLFERVENKYGVFDDSMITDSEYTMNVQSWFTFYYDYYLNELFTAKSVDILLKIRLVSITEAEYYYTRTLNYLTSDIYDDFINDPVSIPSNVHNGTGIVGFSSESGITMQILKDYKLDHENFWGR